MNYATATAAPAVNKVLRNTYMLLSMTLAFSALCTFLTLGVEMTMGTAVAGFITSMVLLVMVMVFRNSILALPLVFAFTGTMGAFIGPAIQQYLEMPNGPEIVMTALGGTTMIFLLLSGYVLTTGKDFSAWGAFVLTGLFVLIGALVLNFFLQMTAFTLAISSMAILLFSALILYDTSRIVNGGETNYVMATVSLYLDVMNLFLYMLQILGIFGGDD